MVRTKDTVLVILTIITIAALWDYSNEMDRNSHLEKINQQNQIEITRLNQINDSLLITIDKRNKRIEGLKTIKKDIKKQIKKDEKDVINIKSTDSIAKLFTRYYPYNR